MSYDDALAALVRRFGVPVGWSPVTVWALSPDGMAGADGAAERDGHAAQRRAATIELHRPAGASAVAPPGRVRVVVRGDGVGTLDASIGTRAELDALVADAAAALRGWRTPRI